MALNGITQRDAHAAIRLVHKYHTPDRRRTRENLDATRNAIRTYNGTSPTDEQIWQATKAPLLSRNVRNFLWKALHGGHKIGNYFTNMPAPWCDYAICPLCEETETLQHILFECRSAETQTIWQLARDFLSPRLDEWPSLEVGSVLGCPLLEVKNDDNKTDHGLSRALRIVISESAFLIWKIRCERRIEYEDHPDDYYYYYYSPTAEEVTGRWNAIINQRIAHDRRLTNKRRYKNKALNEDLVLDTWYALLDLADNVPANWIRHPGVLVGRGTSRPRGRER
ncbi:hypothetical protein EXIGLDRAFT_700811 [Exidia glandulosa HHB12029]|uniref:Uncharacterized protein n=1 Tax=Exidia glandulosa HHB12029 TaxID=1314781 RepID=A0A165M0I0_EXIGL|nr:hypothetical protein EXIGLDRAFT_700811 [Exidia glandulosa HHB12029]